MVLPVNLSTGVVTIRYKNIEKTIHTVASWLEFAKRTGAPCAYEIRPCFRCLNERARLIRTGHSLLNVRACHVAELKERARRVRILKRTGLLRW
jgi:hypothetical protein